jgi:CheY-like chemotaxis protein
MAQFRAALTHAFRSRLNAVLGSLELVSQTNLDDSQRQFVETAVDEGRALLQLVNDSFDMALLDSGEMRILESDVDPVAIAEGALGAVAARVHMRGVAVASIIDPRTPVTAIGDGARLFQVLVNLLDNARKATEHGCVLLTVRPAWIAGVERLQFEVSDTGRGVTEALRERLFEPFLPVGGRADWRMTSLGIGLALCRRLVEMMGGTIHFAVRPGGGSIFSFDVRLRTENECRRLCDEVAEARGREVLLIDDDPHCRASFREQLVGWGMKVQVVADGGAAAEWLTKQRCDLLLVHQDARDADVALAASDAARIVAVMVPIGMPPRVELQLLNRSILWLSSPLRHHTIIDAVMGRVVAPLDLPEIPDSKARDERGRILVIEDSPANQLIMVARLKRMDCKVDAVGTGSEGVRLVSQRRYALVLSDLSLPDMSGLEATAVIRQLKGEAGNVPIVAVTGGTHPRDRERCLAAGMNDLLVKPVEQADLERVVDQFVPRQRRPQSVWSPGPMERMSIDLGAERALEILGTFERELGQRLLRVVGDLPLEKVGLEAHALKSAALTFGAPRLAESARLLEQQCAHKHEADARQTARELVEIGRTVQASIQQWLQESTSKVS